MIEEWEEVRGEEKRKKKRSMSAEKAERYDRWH